MTALSVTSNLPAGVAPPAMVRALVTTFLVPPAVSVAVAPAPTFNAAKCWDDPKLVVLLALTVVVVPASLLRFKVPAEAVQVVPVPFV